MLIEVCFKYGIQKWLQLIFYVKDIGLKVNIIIVTDDGLLRGVHLKLKLIFDKNDVELQADIRVVHFS